MAKGLSVLFASVVIFAVSVYAIAGQRDPDPRDEIPECRASEVLDILTLMQEEGIVQDFSAVYGALSDYQIENSEDIMKDAEDLQVHWWEDIVPEFPRCAFAYELTLKMGRLFDEMLIAAIYAQAAIHANAAGDDSQQTTLILRLDDHSEYAVDLGEEVLEILSVVSSN